ncbi:hypothetical protein [Acaryochloris marina]|uniref:hypothetical protein n=1 Tax=Acaryochloris marina TaxID=155978 RepID=UPI0021C413AA|nr:hypothetical protein [Acaryochloris marina]BDM83855.1 hypothetical protein AM10699_67160 [Acaryochloris marina MBIC10699]
MDTSFPELVVKFIKSAWKIIWTVSLINFATIFFATIHAACLVNLYQDNSEQFYLNLLITLLGGLIGWVIGNLTSPIGKEETKVFGQLGATIATFLSGYVVSKLDRFLEAVLFSEGAIRESSWISLCFFTSALLLSSLTIFLNRIYGLKPSLQSDQSSGTRKQPTQETSQQPTS